MYIWSGGGLDYAQHWSEKLGLKADVIEKGSLCVDLSVDDEAVNLGIINLRVNKS